MKVSFLFLLSLLLTLSASSQIFKKDDIIEVDALLSDTAEGTWARVTVLEATATSYTVKFANGNEMSIPSKNPERWVRPVITKQVINKYSPGTKPIFERRHTAIKPLQCNGAETAVKKNIKSQMAAYYKDFTHILVDFTKFKGQKGFENKKYKGFQVYPYKIEMFVHLRRILVMGGREYTQYQTWEFDRIYEYAPGPNRTCEFYATPSTDARMVASGWY